LQSHSNKKIITETKVTTEAISLLIALFNIAVPTYRSSLTLCDRLSGAQKQSRSFIGEEHKKFSTSISRRKISNGVKRAIL